MDSFFAMGGYAAFVWPSFAVAVIVLGGLYLLSSQALRRRERELEALKALAPHRRHRRQGKSA